MEKQKTSFKNIRKIFTVNFYKSNFSSIFTIAEKNVKIKLRFKFILIYSMIAPFLLIFFSSLVLWRFFDVGVRFGRWDDTNYLIFLFIAYNIELLRKVINDFPNEFRREKFWKTIPALMIAPFSKLHLLLGIFFSHLIIIAIPFVAFLILTYLVYPISIFTIFFIILIFLIIDLIFSGIGLFFGVFAISQETYWQIFLLIIQIVFYMSCITYPFELFPNYIQSIILLNPFYYIFDILRITWIDNNILLTISKYPFHFIVLIGAAIIIPIISIKVFKVVYQKFGISGY